MNQSTCDPEFPSSAQRQTGRRREVMGLPFLCVLACFITSLVHGQTYITPKMGGGNEASAPMIHIDIFYDYDANQMRALLDTSYGVPWLRALPRGYAFNPEAAYGMLEGKSYNYQYGWNLGGLFTPPAGAAIWIEALDHSVGLECYAGRGSLGDYAPIFGTDSSTPLWAWSGIMVHNTYAITNSYRARVTANYRIYFGEAETGRRTGYESYKEAAVRLEWMISPLLHPEALQVGILKTNDEERLHWVNGHDFAMESGRLISLDHQEQGDWAGTYSGPMIFTVLPATAALGGPKTNSPALGSLIEMQVVSIQGPPGGALGFWDPGQEKPVLLHPAGPVSSFRVSEGDGTPESDPFGQILDRRFLATKPGLYTVGFRAVDVSSHGLTRHPPSEVLHLRFQAGLMITSMKKEAAENQVSFRGQNGKQFYLEATDELGAPISWRVVDGPSRGTNATMTLRDSTPGAPQRFYRLKME